MSLKDFAKCAKKNNNKKFILGNTMHINKIFFFIFLVVSVFLWLLVSITNSQQWWWYSRLPVLPSQDNKPSSFSHPWARQNGQTGYMHASPPALTLDTYYLVLARAFDTGLLVEGQPATQTPSMSTYSDALKKSNSRSVRRDCDSKYSRCAYGGKYRSQSPCISIAAAGTKFSKDGTF